VPDAGPPVSFMTDLAPIFGANCTSCHPSRDTYSDVRARVSPGNPNTSVIYQRITGLAGNPMPPGGQLSSTDPAGTELIRRWILQGALNN
jgi:ubiquinol-cytochrome c reductase cytochrome b subunit